MDKIIVQNWIDALRSGKYNQGRKYLHTYIDSDHRFCCLGVLCDLNTSVVKKQEKVDKELEFTFFSYDQYIAMLPDKFKMPKDLQLTLMSMNDSGESFEKIADYIEKKLLKKD